MINAYRAFLGGEYAEARVALPAAAGAGPGRRRCLVRPGRGMVPRHRRTSTWAGSSPRRSVRSAHALAARSRLRPGLRPRADHAERRGRAPAAVRADRARLVRPRRAAGRAAAAGQPDACSPRCGGRGPRRWPRARSWVATQPTTLRAHGAMVNAYVASGNYDAALAEVDRFRQTSTPEHPELPFVEARIRFASGEVDQAARAAPGRARHGGARRTSGPIRALPTVLGDIAAAANVFAYQGDLDQRRQGARPGRPGAPRGGAARRRRAQRADGRDLAPGRAGRALRRRSACPRPSLRQVWQSAAEAGRMATPGRSASIWPTAARPPRSGSSPAWRATAPPWSSTAAMTGEPLSREVRALLALSRGDSAAARRVLAEPDTAGHGMMQVDLGAWLHPAAGGPGVLPPRRLSDDAPDAAGFRARRPSRPAGSTPGGECWAGSACSAPRPTSSSDAEPRRGRSTARSWRSGRRPTPPCSRSSPGAAGAGAAGAGV